MSTACDIVHIDLKENFTRLDGPDDSAPTMLCWRGMPLGQLELETTGRGMSETDFAAAALEAITPELDAHFGARESGSTIARLSRPSDPRRLLRAAMSLLAASRGARAGTRSVL